MWKIEEHLENRKGTLLIEGKSTVEIAEEYGTPTYVTSEKRVRDNVKRIREAFSKQYNNFKLHYAVKANSNMSILRILRQEGVGADCSCVPELFFARLAGFPEEDMIYTGNYNTESELEYSSKLNCTINIDDISILPMFAKHADPSQTRICFRVNPGIGEGGTGTAYAGPDAKFGVPAEKVPEAYEQAKKLGFERFGMHMMTGTNIKNDHKDYFPTVTEKIMEIAGKVRKENGIQFEFINIGGGFGVAYRPDEIDLDLNYVTEKTIEKFKEGIGKYDLGNPFLFIEPGRYLVCDSTILLARVQAIKRAAKTFVGCDAGMNTLLRPMLYDAYHAIYVANNLNSQEKEKVNVCGQICENTDLLAKDRELTKTKEGDLLAILNGGAYGFVMSSNYNSRPRAAEVLVSKGKSFLIRERENEEDLLRRQRIPAHLLAEEVQ